MNRRLGIKDVRRLAHSYTNNYTRRNRRKGSDETYLKIDSTVSTNAKDKYGTHLLVAKSSR